MVRKRRAAIAAGAIVAGVSLIAAPIVYADIVHNDDVIIIGSLCVGFDCNNGVAFGFDTIRLKENNLRIHFEDTSNSASFPTNDWRIRINDTTNGGDSYFAVEDSTAGNVPFRVEAGAGANALFVDRQGDVGIGTASPVTELHIADGDTPTARLEQNGTSGFTPQTWDLAGNETNFFVRDVTNGSKLPFRIRPNSPTSSIDVFADKIQVGTSAQKIGVGTNAPTEAVHVLADNAKLRLQDPTPGATGNAAWNIGMFPTGDLVFVNDTTAQLRIFNDGKFRHVTKTSPPASGVIGDMYFDDSGAACFFDGSGWVEMGVFA